MEHLWCKCTQALQCFIPGKMRTQGQPRKLPSPKKLTRLGHFPLASQAGHLAGPVFYVNVFSLACNIIRWSMRRQNKAIKEKSSMLRIQLHGIMQKTRSRIFLEIVFLISKNSWGGGGVPETKRTEALFYGTSQLICSCWLERVQKKSRPCFKWWGEGAELKKHTVKLRRGKYKEEPNTLN